MRLLNDKELARMIGVTVACIRKWRREGRGPSYMKVEGSIRYREKTVLEFLDGCVVPPAESIDIATESQVAQ